MVVFQSSKPEAKTFQKWITKEVIPQIRKTGSYAIDNKLPANFAEALKLAYEQQLEIENKKTQLELQKPAVEYYEAVTDSRDALPVGDVAKLLFDNYQITMGRNELFEFLREKKVLMDDNKPYQKYVDIGYFRVVQQKYDVNGETKINIKTLVFQKGVEFILKLIKQKLS
jgi:phage antirepressor YoqD-like protein